MFVCGYVVRVQVNPRGQNKLSEPLKPELTEDSDGNLSGVHYKNDRAICLP